MADTRIETRQTDRRGRLSDEIQELSKREMQDVTGGDGTRGSGKDALFGGICIVRASRALNPYVTIDYLQDVKP